MGEFISPISGQEVGRRVPTEKWLRREITKRVEELTDTECGLTVSFGQDLKSYTIIAHASHIDPQAVYEARMNVEQTNKSYLVASYQPERKPTNTAETWSVLKVTKNDGNTAQTVLTIQRDKTGARVARIENQAWNRYDSIRVDGAMWPVDLVCEREATLEDLIIFNNSFKQSGLLHESACAFFF